MAPRKSRRAVFAREQAGWLARPKVFVTARANPQISSALPGDLITIDSLMQITELSCFFLPASAVPGTFAANRVGYFVQ